MVDKSLRAAQGPYIFMLAMHTLTKHQPDPSGTTIGGTAFAGCPFLPSRFKSRSRMESRGGTSDAGTMRLDKRLNMPPKHSATTVHVRIITLYGILKSGVGRDNRRLVVLTTYAS